MTMIYNILFLHRARMQRSLLAVYDVRNYIQLLWRSKMTQLLCGYARIVLNTVIEKYPSTRDLHLVCTQICENHSCETFISKVQCQKEVHLCNALQKLLKEEELLQKMDLQYHNMSVTLQSIHRECSVSKPRKNQDMWTFMHISRIRPVQSSKVFTSFRFEMEIVLNVSCSLCGVAEMDSIMK